uniref:dolichyl-phosphate-mannose--protein mannosyltransferase n=1 Tax=Nocardia gipuzkoensis TaxID=2749991 RepID=UPI003CC7DF7B
MTQVTDQRATARFGTVPSWSSPGPLRPTPDFGPTDRLRGWLVTAFLTAIAAVTRFTMLNYPTDAGTPVFDEKHYAPQAWQMLTGGWVEDNPGYGLVVHPPVGKQFIALGEAMFGYNGWGWRFTAAVAGTVLVLLVIRIVRRLARSTLIGAIAGLLLIADGLTFVSSRIGMLDIFMALFVTAAFGCLIVDRDEIRTRFARVDAHGRIGVTDWGPRLGVRWWRFGAGVLLGLACGTKWSGVYFIAAFGLMSVYFDLSARRTYGVRRPWLGVALRDVGPALYALVLVPLGVYLASYWAWFASETGVYRYMPGNPSAPTDPNGTGGFCSHVAPGARAALVFFKHTGRGGRSRRGCGGWCWGAPGPARRRAPAPRQSQGTGPSGRRRSSTSAGRGWRTRAAARRRSRPAPCRNASRGAPPCATASKPVPDPRPTRWRA